MDFNFSALDGLTNEELLDELMSRYDHAVFAGLRMDGDGNEIERDWMGDETFCKGLAVGLGMYIERQAREIVGDE